MSKIFLILSLFLLCSEVFTVEKIDGSIILNDRTFDIEKEKYEHLLVFFYNPGCEHCKKFEPEFQKLTNKLLGLTPPIIPARIEGDFNKETSIKYKVQSVPSLILFTKGRHNIRYVGKMKYDDIFLFIDFHVQQTVEHISNKQINDFLANHKDGFIFVGSHEEKNRIYNYWAKSYADITFGICPSPECLSRFNSTNGDIFYFDYNGDEIIKYDETLYSKNLGKFLSINSIRPVTRLNSFVNELIFSYRHAGLFLFTQVHELSKTLSNQVKMLKKAIQPYKVNKLLNVRMKLKLQQI